MNKSNHVLDQFCLDGRTALITGGSQGLGEVIAHAYAQAGARVIITSRRLESCQAVARKITNETAAETFALAADVSSSKDVEQLYQEVKEKVGPVDIIVNSAGINIRGSITDITEENWDSIVDINLKAPFLMARRFAPDMAERGWGRIIHLGSILSAIGIANRAPYASSKTGLIGLTRVLAMEFASKGVTVNAICPGTFATEMNRPLLDDPKIYADFVSKIPLGRWGDLSEITGPALFLASNASSFMTGSTLYIDGGWTAQ